MYVSKHLRNIFLEKVTTETLKSVAQQMETFSALLVLCGAQRPVTRNFDVFFDLRLNEWLSKQSWGWSSETHRAHYDVIVMF